MSRFGDVRDQVQAKLRREGVGGVARALGRRLRVSDRVAASAASVRSAPERIGRAPSDPWWEDLVAQISPEDSPRLEQPCVGPSELTADQQFYRENGYLIVPGVLPDEEVERYSEVRERFGEPGGYAYNTPFIDVPEIRDLCLCRPVAEKLEELIEEPMGMQLALTGWVSTERNWHQDAYLNPEEIGGYYCAVWYALADIDPDAGPFEFVPGSHRWGHLSRGRVLAHIPRELREDPSWPKHSERFLTDIFDDQVRRRGLESKQFLAKKGDMLIWHPRLMHRGSAPLDRSLERRTIIAHFSSIYRRPDMPPARQHDSRNGGGYFFAFPPIASFEVIESRDRAQVAKQYLLGKGLELGALNAPTSLPPGATVDYVDCLPLAELLDRFPEFTAEQIVAPTVIEDGFELASVTDGSQDFIVANHVLEHAVDPVQAILTWDRVVRHDGVLFVGVPIVDRCFDAGRPTTSLEHMLDDHHLARDGKFSELAERNRAHYEEWVNISEIALDEQHGLPLRSAEQRAERVGLLMREQFEIHFHAFSADSLREFLQYVHAHLGGPELIDMVTNDHELIAVLRSR